jgi:limonene 1,2-monooxygenase
MDAKTGRLRFGAFIAPYHGRDENPSLALHRDLWLAELLDRLGYDEVWIGEHHSAAFETIGSPELFIATAAERTRSIRLGTGVVSLPYHNLLMLAERINYLDHITRGRVMFGVGPGALPSDAAMMGLPIADLRLRMNQALDVLVPLLRGEEVTASTEWFSLKNARLQMVPWSLPSVDMAVASLVSPSGATAAGRHGLGLLSFQSQGKEAFNSLASNWAIAEQVAREHGKTVDRSNWRLVVQMHIAETRDQAIRDCRFGLEKWLGYFRDVAQLPIVPDNLTGDDLVQTYAELGVSVIGTPDDAIATIERLQKETGGFGCIMLLAHNWANSRATAESYELIARYVVPHFQRLNVNREASLEWVLRNRQNLGQQAQEAVANKFAEHAAKYGTDNLSPEIREMLARGTGAR